MRVLDFRRTASVDVLGSFLEAGSDEGEKWHHAQEGVRRKVVGFCQRILRMIGRVGIMDDRQTRIAMNTGVEGSIGFYARRQQ